MVKQLIPAAATAAAHSTTPADAPSAATTATLPPLLPLTMPAPFRHCQLRRSDLKSAYENANSSIRACTQAMIIMITTTTTTTSPTYRWR